MKTSRILNLTIASLFSLAGCGGTVSTLEPYGEGTGARQGDGDGDAPVASGGGQPGDGDGDAPATGARTGDGDGDSPLISGGQPGGGGDGVGGGRDGGGGVPVGTGGGSIGGRPIGSGGLVWGGGGVLNSTGGSGPTGGVTGSGGFGGTIDGCHDLQIYDQGTQCNAYARCESEDIWSSCYGSSCSCGGPRGWAEFQVADMAGTVRCQELLSYCASDAFNTPSSDEVCERTYYEQSSDYCSAQSQCTQDIGLESGAAKVTSWRETYCSRDDSSWQCTCTTPHNEMRFELDADVESSEICQEISDNVCDGSAIEVIGPSICDPEYQSASKDACDIQFSCAAPATINGFEGRLFDEYRSASCVRTADGFYCSCATQGFVVQAEDAWSACSDLAQRCGSD